MAPTSRRKLGKQLERLIREVADPSASPSVERELNVLGYPNLTESFEQIALRLGGSPGHLATLMVDLLDSPHPDSAFVNLLRYLEASGASGAFLDTMAAGKPLREILATIFGSSQYMSDIIIRNPGYLYWLLEQSTWESEDTTDWFSRQLEVEAANFNSSEGKLHAVRRYHRRALLKTGVADLLGFRSVEETTAVLSNLADAITRVIVRLLWHSTVGDAEPDTGFAVIALGKLGGGELNYSSDIDLLYICDDVDDARYEEFARLARDLTRALSDVTREGYLYRVDLRLRPDGSVGPIVNTLTALRIYYENRGRPWEFQAMLKARVIAGDHGLGARFLTHISGLVFNPALSYSPVEAISLMRTRIRQNISSKDRSFNIKLMEGGIRDIEFIVQTLQLLYGNKEPSLRTPNTLRGLEEARRAGLVSAIEHETLAGAYRFFRQVEHRLQMMHQIKTHSIPESREDIERLAQRVSHGVLGTYSGKQFLERLTSNLNQVRLLSDSFFSGKEVPEAAVLLLMPGGDETAHETLRRHGIVDPKRALSIVQSLAHGSFPKLVDRNTRASFQKLLPELLELLARSGDPDRSLINFSNLAAATRNVSPFYDFLAESSAARDLIFKTIGVSTLLTGKLCANIDALDTLLEDPATMVETPAQDEINWPALVEDGRDRRLFRQELCRALDLRVLAAWLLDCSGGKLPLRMPATIHLTTQRIVAAAFAAVLEDLDNVAVLALGSFGVGEPRITSDVDLLVVTRERDREPITRRLHTLNQALSEGSGLKLDFRLRGEGANAPLVQELSFYEGYFQRRMAAWERIAFAKCAMWQGDEALARDFLAALEPHLTRPLTHEDGAALTQTRKKLERLAARGDTVFETKRCAGGRYDIEYLSWIGLVLSGHGFDTGMSSHERIDTITGAGVITDADAQALKDALEFFTRIDYLMELQELSVAKTRAKATALAHYLDKTLDLLGVPTADGVEPTLAAHKHRVRACYDSVIDKMQASY